MSPKSGLILILLAVSAAPLSAEPIDPLATSGRDQAFPLGVQSNWITAKDYPATLDTLPDRGSAIILEVDQKGKAIGCEVHGSSGVAELDRLACRLLTERGRFKASAARHPFGVVVHWDFIGALAPGHGAAATPLRAPVPILDPMDVILAKDIMRRQSAILGQVRYSSARVLYRLDIDASGKVTGCTANSPDKQVGKYEKLTCDYLADAQFEPALDPSGQKVAGVYRNHAFWEYAPNNCATPRCSVENDQTYNLAQMPEGWQAVTLDTDVLVGADGTNRDCVVRSVYGGMDFPGPGEKRAFLGPLATLVCKQVIASWKAEAGHDAGGKPVDAVQTMRLQVKLPVLPAPPSPALPRPVPKR